MTVIDGARPVIMKFLDTAPEDALMQRYTFEQFAAVRSYADISFSPDGEHLAFVTNVSGQLNVWRQPVAAGPGDAPLAPLQLTALVDSSARRAVWSLDGSSILTLADREGTEN